MKIKPFKHHNDLPDMVRGYTFICPGCDEEHSIHTVHDKYGGSCWRFDGNEESPTFTPSVLIKTGKYVDPNYVDDPEMPRSAICHLFIRSGQIEYLSDCTHHLAGKTVPMEDIT